MTADRLRAFLTPTRVARAVKHRVLRRLASPTAPLVSVVVPLYDAAPYLAECLDQLLGQTHPDLEVILVDDGSSDGSLRIARRYAEAHDRIRLVEQPHAGVGAARNRGADLATGEYLAFCDADDLVRPQTYERLADSLERTGSDFAVGSVAVQRYGMFTVPDWAARAHDHRREAVRLEDVPEVMANQFVGARLFRRSFWDAHGYAFPTGTDHCDAALLTRSMLDARAFDVLPAVVYQWRWREDMRSIAQRDLREPARVAARVSSLADAGELLVRRSGEDVQQQFFVEILHTTIPDLVKAAVCRDDGFWEALSEQLRRLTAMMSGDTLQHVPVEDRIVAVMCAEDRRAPTENFLQYAKENRFGLPYRRIDGHSYVSVPFVDVVATQNDALLRVAESDLRYRTRLTTLRWVAPGRLHLEGAAFVEYHACPDSEITLVLRGGHGDDVVVATTRPESTTVNQWSERAHEDHEGGAFSALIDVHELLAHCPEGAEERFDVLVRLRADGAEYVDHLQTRQVNGSAGLLEPCRLDGVEAVPRWRPFEGLAVVVRPGPTDSAPDDAASDSPVWVDALIPLQDAAVEVRGGISGRGPVDIALHGPRSSTPWVAAVVGDGRFTASLPVCQDEWGLGRASLPIDPYRVVARTADGAVIHMQAAASLRRLLPEPMRCGDWRFAPSTTPEGQLSVRIEPAGVQGSRSAYHRQRLRDTVYEPARTRPLLDAVLFETFAGKAAGDNPGPLCEEFARRSSGLDLAYSVTDLSIVLPPKARPVLRWSPEWHELMGRARFLVTNANMPYHFRKREGQMFLQTWHGTPLKRIAHDRPNLDFDNWHHRRQLTSAVRDWDFLVTQSEFCTRALRSAFRYEGEVLETGYPRNDVLSSSEKDHLRAQVRSRLGISERQRVVLYAPTWRDNMRRGMVFNKVLYLDTHQMVERLDDTVVLVRGHYNTIGAPRSERAGERVLDVTRYPDISHLYLAADALVTDYSSVFFDFVITDRPMVFLAPDLEHYRDETRGFYLDYHDTVPGPVCDSTTEVIEALAGPDRFGEVRRHFRARFTPLDDGQASRRVVDAVFGAVG